MSQQIAVRIPDEEVAALDAAVASGSYKTRAAAVRAGVEHVLREERKREIAESYRRAYAKHPAEKWIGEAGAILAEEAVLRERERPRS